MNLSGLNIPNFLYCTKNGGVSKKLRISYISFRFDNFASMFVTDIITPSNMIRIVRATSDNQHFTGLTAQLDSELWERYPVTQDQYEGYNKMDKAVKVILAFDEAEAVGCGAFRELGNQEVEIKRMFVHRDHRGRGISKLILQALEAWAREQKHNRAKLETGIRQPEAINLYKRAGYALIPNYGPYQDMPESVCMQKDLLH